MLKFKKYKTPIKGNLDIVTHDKEDEFDGVIEKWTDVLIHGDPEGLRSFAKFLIEIADLDQNTILDLPVGAREHFHLRPKIDLGKSSVEVIVGRLDAKETGEFYKSFKPRNVKK